MSEFFEALVIGAVVTTAIFWLSGIIARLFVLWIAWASIPTFETGELRESGIKVIQARDEIAPHDTEFSKSQALSAQWRPVGPYHGINATRTVVLAIRKESAQPDPVFPPRRRHRGLAVHSAGIGPLKTSGLMD
jgi:hypothetical protein